MCGDQYFLFPWSGLSVFQADDISRKELLACLIAIWCFSDKMAGCAVKLWSDNTSAVQWLQKGRSSNERGNKYLACWELQKYLLKCKVSTGWIPGDKNNTADELSRGSVPEWLQRRGVEQKCDLGKLAFQLTHAELCWKALS